MANIPLPPGSSRALGESGTNFFHGYISGEDYARDLQGILAVRVYDVMRRSDPVIRAIIKVVTDPILSANWDIEPASKETRDIKIAEHAKYEFFDRKLDYYDIMREGFSFLPFGHFVAEKIYDTKAVYNGKRYIGFENIASRKQSTILKWQMDNGQPGITQTTPFDGSINIPRQKLLYVVNNQEGENYNGESFLRSAYKPWKIKDSLEIMNAVALENQGMGIMYIKKMTTGGQSIDETELENVRQRVRQQRANEEAYLEFPDTIDVGFLDMKGHTTKDIPGELKRLDEQITLSALAQFLLLGQTGGGGSRAVSQDHSRLFVKALISVARIWQIAFQRDVINDWADLNYSDLQNGYPKLVFSTISDEDVPETSTAVNQLMQVGALTPGLELENRLRRMLNLPELSQQEYDQRQQQKQSNDVAKAQAPATTGDKPTDPQADQNNPETDGPAGETDLSVEATIAEAERIERELLSIIAGR